jgi:hypothetical protein
MFLKNLTKIKFFYQFKNPMDIPLLIRNNLHPCNYMETCPLCHQKGIIYLVAIDHLLQCVPKYINQTINGQFLDIFLFIIGAKKEMDPNVNLKSMANIIHVRNLYFVINSEIDGKFFYDEWREYPNKMIIERIELLILNALDITKLNLQFFPID